MRPIELLLPAGDYEKMEFAFAFGADAVYLGIPRYSLRARENGFTTELVMKAVDYAHQIDKKIYVTANVFPHNHKLDPFLKYLDEFLAQCQPDAWIMSDPGIITMFKQKHPEQIIHLSVQANTVNYASAKFWEKTGINRIILSRELSIPEIKRIKDYCPNLEIEVFVHGSICVAYSGRCLLSNYMAYRDSNLGTCANSCRWQYKVYKKEDIQPQNWMENAHSSEVAITQHGDSYIPIKGDFYLEEFERPGQFIQIDEDENGTYLMNARDLCSIEYLQELYDAGIDSFKVEGRSKSVYYVSHIARAYRAAVDDLIAKHPFNPLHMKDIFATSNRGFTAGFLKGNPGRSSQKFDSASSENPCYRFAALVRGYNKQRKMIKIEPRNKIWTGMTLELVFKNETLSINIEIIYDEKYTEISEIHGGIGKYYWIPCQIDPGKFALLREKLSDYEYVKS